MNKKKSFHILFFQHLSFQQLQPPPLPPSAAWAPPHPPKGASPTQPPALSQVPYLYHYLGWQIFHILLCPPLSFPSVYSMPISDTTQLSPRQSCHRNGSTSKTNTHPRNTDGGKKQTIKHQHQKGLKFPVLDQKYLLFGGILP